MIQMQTRRPPLSYYPQVTLTNGTSHRVDRAGLIIGQINGHCRIDHRWQPPDDHEIASCLKWLQRVKRSNDSRLTSSYRMKHSCERWVGRYCSNGAMVLALQIAKFDLHPDPFGHFPLNVAVQIDWRSYAALPECKVSRVYRPGGNW
jgi:hypothetical protein